MNTAKKNNCQKTDTPHDLLTMHITRIICTTVLAVVTAGCSRIQIAYNQLDWLLPYYVETYVELSDKQSSYLELQVNNLLAWHCSTQVNSYAELLRAASADFQNGRMTRKRLEDYSGRIERFWNDILLQASPTIANLLLETDEVQLAELYNSFEERNREWLANYNDVTQKERRKNYITRMKNELKRWFGPLQPAQQQAVVEWSYHFQPLGLEGLQMRKAWQSRLHGLISHRDDRETFIAGIHDLLINPGEFRSAAYRERLAYNREKTIELVYTTGALLNQEQRHHMDHKAESIVRELEKLSCADGNPGDSAKGALSYSQYQ